MLRVNAAHAEPGAPPDTAPRLAAELGEMARWLGVERVEAEGGGDLTDALAASLLLH